MIWNYFRKLISRCNENIFYSEESSSDSEMIRSKLIFPFPIIWLLIINTGSQGDFSESNFQEIVYPTVISREEVRRRRSILDLEDSESIYISISNWTLKTRLNNGFIIPSEFVVEWIHSNNSENQEWEFSTNCEARYGSVEGMDSIVILTICQGEFYGMMLADNRYLFIRPLMDGKHLLYEDNNIFGWETKKEDNDFVSLFRDKNNMINLKNNYRELAKGESRYKKEQ